MDTLPPETLQKIFEFACTDGGYTGHSLSLVSKAISEIARTTRFHSVSLAASPRRLQAFVRLYERECDPARGYKPRIQHLHVTFPRILRPNPRNIDGTSTSWAPRRRSLSPSPRPLPSTTSSSPSYRLRPILPSNSAGRATGDLVGTSAATALQPTTQREMGSPLQGEAVVAPVPPVSTRTSRALPALPRRTSDTEGEATHDLFVPPSVTSPDPTISPEYRNAAQTLFRLVASDLVTLVVQSGFTAGGTLHLPIIDRPFPRLLEATFVGLEYPHALLADESDGAKTVMAPLFPAVTHLYVAPWSNCGLCLPFWSTNAPRVTYLSISCAEFYINEIAGVIGVRVEPVRSQWGWDDDSDSESDSPSSPIGIPLVPTYPSVRHLLLQPGPGPIGARCGGPWMGHHRTMQMLRQVERSCQAIGVEIVEVAAPKDNKFGVYYERARRGWLDRIDDGSDGAGFWGDMVVSHETALEAESRSDSSTERLLQKLGEVVGSLTSAGS